MPFIIGARAFRIVYGFDRITLWFDRADIPIVRKLLRPHCRVLKLKVRQMLKNPLWKLKMRVFQPSQEFFRVLQQALGASVRVLVTYVEITRDILARNQSDIPLLLAEFLAAATVPRLHLPSVQRSHDIYYYNYRSDEHGKRRTHVPLVYADMPSKLARKGVPVRRNIPDTAPRCLHNEWRCSGSAAIGVLGIASIADLLGFDFVAFFARHMPFRKLPASRTALGQMLPGKREVNPDTCRKRARAFVANATRDDGHFVLHNAVRAAPSKFASRLESMTLEEWLSNAIEKGSNSMPD
ncbi:hypothetical protein GFK26_12635 [Variovorax paradoxus]|uniref:Uncharacterized protein n=1 Tax=Variovorax paradoxus TaxID=34073 RepID=A0A5Q0M4R0_VARPD|nr:hypothetical protein [Variovorax paradoxus]QFZ83544.1 hypothetical protein GFK26_12635 [Variovorax paradoxus]